MPGELKPFDTLKNDRILEATLSTWIAQIPGNVEFIAQVYVNVEKGGFKSCYKHICCYYEDFKNFNHVKVGTFVVSARKHENVLKLLKTISTI